MRPLTARSPGKERVRFAKARIVRAGGANPRPGCRIFSHTRLIDYGAVDIDAETFWCKDYHLAGKVVFNFDMEES